MTYLFNALGLIPMAAFMVLLLWPRRTSAPLVEPERDGEGDYIFRVTRDEVMRGAWPAQQKRGEQ